MVAVFAGGMFMRFHAFMSITWVEEKFMSVQAIIPSSKTGVTSRIVHV